MPPAPGYEWVWQPFPQGGGTFVQREVPKPPPASDVATNTALATIGTTVLTGAITLLEKWLSRPVAPPAPAQPSPMESLASKLIERQLTTPAQAPAPAVDPKAIEASLRMEYEMKALREQVTRLRETRGASAEPKQPASEDFLKQFERYKELAEKLNPSARDEAQSTLGMIADLADTEGGKELLAKVGEGFARWLNAQPTPTMSTSSTSPAPVVLTPVLPAHTPGVTASAFAPTAAPTTEPTVAHAVSPGSGAALDPDGYHLCLDCKALFARGTEDEAAHAGHTVAPLAAPKVHEVPEAPR
jgi:hypothetical protein